MRTDSELISDFVGAFPKLDDLSTYYEVDPVAWEFAEGEFDEYGRQEWRPRKVTTNPSLLEPLYKKLPARFPPLYEQLVLSYRWARVDLGILRLLANPLGEDLSRLLEGIYQDKGLADALIPNGYLQFGFAPDVNYDPVCFDTRTRVKDGECRVVQLDHEEILCNFRLREVEELATSFRKLMARVIDEASTIEGN